MKAKTTNKETTRAKNLTFENVATFLIGCIFGGILLNGLYLVLTKTR